MIIIIIFVRKKMKEIPIFCKMAFVVLSLLQRNDETSSEQNNYKKTHFVRELSKTKAFKFTRGEQRIVLYFLCCCFCLFSVKP